MPRAASTAAWLVLLVGLGAAAAFNLWLALQLLGRPDETRYGEAILYDHASRLLRGEALYQPLDGPPYTIATYTPLYYWLAAGLRVLVGPGFLAGRLVSLGAGLVSAGLVGWLVWRHTRAAVAAFVAGLVFIGLGLGGLVPWSAAYKEDLLAVALGVASVVTLDSAPARPGRVVLAGGLAAAAVLTKQSLAGPAIVGVVWLLAARRVRLAALFAATVLVLGLWTGALLEVTTHAFVANALGGNLHQPFDVLTFEVNVRELAIYQTVPSVLTVAAIAVSRRRHVDLLVLSWLGSLLPMLALGAIGADSNYWLQFAALSAVLATLWLWRVRRSWWGVIGAVLLVGNAALAVQGVAGWLQARPGFLASGAAVAEPMRQLVERVSRSSGTVLADPLDVLVLAGRPVLLEPIVYGLREQDGSWDPSPLVARVCGGEVSLVVLGYPLEEIGQRFPRAVAAAVQQTFVIEQTVRLGGGQRWVLVPRTDRSGCFT